MWAIGSIKEDYLGYAEQANSCGAVLKRIEADTPADASRIDPETGQAVWFIIGKVPNSTALSHFGLRID